MVLKPATQTPLTALALGADLPGGGRAGWRGERRHGVGAGARRGAGAHPRVDKVAFTGSTEVGRELMRMAADDIKRVSLELGGKSANIVFDDADLDKAVEMGVRRSSPTRAGLHRALAHPGAAEHPRRVHRAVRRADEALKVGNPLDKATDMGAIISPQQKAPVRDYIEIGQQEGAQLLTGGRSRRRGAGKGQLPDARRLTNVTPRCVWCRKRSSVRSRRSCRLTPRTTRCALPTTASTGCPDRSGAATSAA